jgi:hypothetical protein
MKLLSANEVKVKKESQDKAEVYQTQKVKLELWEETQKLKKFRDDSQAEKEKLFRIHFNLQQKLEKEREELKRDIEVLKSKKETALVPLEILKTEIEKREESVSLAEQRIHKMEVEIKKQKTLLAEKSDNLAKIEQEIGDKEALSYKNYDESRERLKNIKAEEKKQAERGEMLARYDINLQKKSKELEDKEKSIQAKLEANSEKEKEISKKLKIIESRQAQLKAAFQELKKNA